MKKKSNWYKKLKPVYISVGDGNTNQEIYSQNVHCGDQFTSANDVWEYVLVTRSDDGIVLEVLELKNGLVEDISWGLE
jgi:hypothetical protein